MIDSHAHVHDKQFDRDRAETIERARSAGITEIVNVGCDLADSARALDAARTYDLRASVGVHPHEAIDAPEDLATAFAPFCEDERVVAIGETGLDYYYEHSPREKQRDVFRKQLRIARERSLPVIFHHRDAFDDFVSILREEWKPEMRGVIHCFTGDVEQAYTYTGEFRLLLGIGGVVTFKSADQVREAVRAVGLQSLMLETDCPYLAPTPLRGQRNEPAFMARTVDKLADVLGLPAEEIVATTDRNTRSLFGL